MIALRRLKPFFLRPSRGSTSSHQYRRLQDSKVGSNRKKALPCAQPQKLSLLEELFPYDSYSNRTSPQAKDQDVPRLPLPDVDGFFEDLQDDLDRSRKRPNRVTKTAAAHATRHQNMAVLALQIASKSLIESDFRRVAPKGSHINDWTGPGDILRVIPARDPRTLEQANYYFILFPNPAYARTYQNHVVHLHRVARTHTPTSIESPLPLQPGVIVEGEDAYALLQNYALCPPSQRLQLKLMYPSYTPGTKTVLQGRGYPQLVDGTDKTGRSVLFRVGGQQVTTPMIRSTIAAEGRQRGLAWTVSIEKLDTSQVEVEDHTSSDYDESTELRPQRHDTPRWILSFDDENEARRFIRTWHRKHFPLTRSGGARLVHAEFLW